MEDEGSEGRPQGTPQGAAADEEWFSRLTFRFAKTMPDNPHEYVVRSPENEDAYVKLWETIKERGVNTRWNGRSYRYWYRGDGWRYWYMGALYQSRIINRAKVEGIEGNGHELLDPDGTGGGAR
jgi:hypothetical protein